MTIPFTVGGNMRCAFFGSLLALALFCPAPISAQVSDSAQLRILLDSASMEMVRLRAFNRAAETQGTKVLSLLSRAQAIRPPIGEPIPPDTVLPPVPPDTTPTGSPHTDLLFQSSWDTLGNDAAAWTDGGKWNNLTVGSASAVVSTASTGRGFPTPNVFAPNWSNSGSETLLRYNAWSFPAIGQSLGYRFYKSVEIPDSYISFGGADHQNHPIQDSLNGSENWVFVVRTNAGAVGAWSPRFSLSTGNWDLMANLDMGVPYRFEILLTRISETQFELRVRIYEPPIGGWASGEVGTLIYDEDDFEENRVSLGTNPAHSISTTSMNTNGITAGTNGWSGDDNYTGGNFVPWYQAAFAVHTTWPGPWIQGERVAR